jgi:hypothetical protein
MMTGLPACKTKPPGLLPERFRASASEWIDRANFGDLPGGKMPPAGIRLRWNWPLSADGARRPSGAPAFPKRFSVFRCGPIHPERLMNPKVTVGHMPRMLAPEPLWRPLLRAGDRDLVVGADPIACAQAIHIVMEPYAERVSIALIDAAGETRLTGELAAGDALYCELGDIHRVIFSAPPRFASARGLSLTADDALAADLNFARIATLDARAWLAASLDEVSDRMASELLTPFVTIADREWQDLQQRGRVVVAALDAGSPPPLLELNFLKLGIAMRWEVASLVGWGFLDGEHVTSPRFDLIDSVAMLTPAESGAYAYQIVADFEGSDHWAERSDIALTLARPMPALVGAEVRPLAPPKSRGELVNQIDQGMVGAQRAFATPVERTFCASSWLITARAPYAERVFTSPRSADSRIIQPNVEEAGEFSADGARRPSMFRGMERLELRDHSFSVPFFDSDIWLTLATGDHWDRRVTQAATPPIQPEIEYHGRCIGLSGGKCDPTRETAELSLDQAAEPGWTADPLATFARATIELLVKDPELDRLVADVILFAASPARAGSWSAVIEADLATEDLAPFIGGTLETGGFQGRILGFAPEQRRRFRCEFESIAVCAGAPLYNAGPAGVPAQLSEAEGSDRVWDVAGEIPLLLDGSPASAKGTIELPKLEASTLLFFSTRLSFEFEGRRYRGPLSPRAAVPYVHPAPKPPELCMAIRVVAVDYYGRAVVRAEALDCERFDPALAVAIEAAAGIVVDAEAFPSAASKGLFGQQAPLGHRVVFDAFELLAHRPDGAVDTLGVRYVRTSDGRESEPDLRQFGNRRTD